MRVLVTSGATREPIDGIRFLTNFSTGETGAALADFFSRRGHRVTYMHGLGAAQPRKAARRVEFADFQDLDRKLRAALKKERVGTVLHLAAVSDFSVADVLVGGRRRAPGRLSKISSTRTVSLRLRRNFKILDRLPRYAAGRPLVVGFKLTSTRSRAAALKAVGQVRADLVVHNNMRDIRNGKRKFSVFRAGALIAECGSREALARALCAAVEGRN